ncbi:MAG TPA: hypothetical protein VL098_13615 [Flavipsychrobacter sp.]|nr:hypothetical protein [Flavipsychrobacter sp.]
MKRILFLLSIVLFSNMTMAQQSDKENSYDAIKTEQKAQINAKYEEIKSLLDKSDYTKAKQVYADVDQMMQKSLKTDEKYLRKAKTELEKDRIQQSIKTKTSLYDAAKAFATADIAKDGKRISVYIMEFAFVTGKM